MVILLMTQRLICQRSTVTASTVAGEAEQQPPAQLSHPMPLQPQKQPQLAYATPSDSSGTPSLSHTDLTLIVQLQQLLLQQQLYLQTNLRLTDIAQQLQVPEYRVSRLLRSQFHATNFNHFINTLRIEHAKTLLTDPGKQHWPVLVVGLESGFASVGPFTRAFKTQTGDTPNEYRLKQREPLLHAKCAH